MSRRTRLSYRPEVDPLDPICLPSALTPAQVAAAYGLNAISFANGSSALKGNGAGQIIAIIDAYHDPDIASDLAAFNATYGLTSSPLIQVDFAGAATNDGWAEEEALDVEWAHAMAPGAAIMIVEAKSDGLWDLLTAVDWARHVPNVSTISMSWGSSEFSGQTSLDYIFTTPAGHNGITFIAASGDSGAAGGAEWPASSANVLAVGGTTLQINTAGAYLGETLWSGSSGGSSAFVSEPSYQRSLKTTGRRTTPDVSFDGDPNTGVSVYVTLPSNGRAGWEQVGGTSLGAPAWAGILAIADEGRATTGKKSLDGVSQTLPALYALPASDFHKVASRSTVTAGLGTPNGLALVNALAYSVPAAGVSTSAVTTSSISSSGILVTAASSTTTTTTSFSPPPSARPSTTVQTPSLVLITPSLPRVALPSIANAWDAALALLGVETE